MAILFTLQVKTRTEKQNLLEKKSEVAIKWFERNNMVENSGKFNAIFIKRKNKFNNNSILKIKKKLKLKNLSLFQALKLTTN